MNIPTKKLKSGFELPIYGLGLWEIGGKREADSTKDEAEVVALQAAIDLGVTHFNTAEGYGNGHAEELLGQAIKGQDRSKLIIATKVAGKNQGHDDLMRSFETSLKRLDTDYVDLYMLHEYPSFGIDIKETMKAMDELVRQGVVKNIGVSNLTPNRFNEAQKHSENRFVCNQVHYNLEYREIEEKGVLKQCQDEDIMLVAWRPIQKGRLPSTQLINKLASKYNKTPNQIAINWLISQDNVVTISKTSNLEHLKENLGALDWTMEPEDVELIRSQFPDQKFRSDVVPLDYAADIEP